MAITKGKDQNSNNVNILSEICKDLQDLYYLQEYGTEDQKVNLVLGMMTKYELKLQQSLDIKLVTPEEVTYYRNINGKDYKTTKEPISDSCRGCVGNTDRDLCANLSDHGCSENKIIWLKVE